MSEEPLPHEFDRALSQTPRVGRSGVYDLELADDWRVGGGLNGGFLLAHIGQALRTTLTVDQHPDPLALSVYYLSASLAGPAAVETTVLRRGRSMSTAQASLTQPRGDEQVERLRALATYGDLVGLPDDVRTSASPPQVPPPQDCLGAELVSPELRAASPFLDRFDLRLDPATAGWAKGEPSGHGEIRGWFRLHDGREPDPLLLLLAVDALPPVTFDLGMFGWAPTVELTIHVRADPAPGWLLLRHATRNFAGGLLEEDAEVWDSGGRLVAQSRQLARAPRPR
jgi:hypothetical protein